MTINQILDKILSSPKSSDKLIEIKNKLFDLKEKNGGNVQVENSKEILEELNSLSLNSSIDKAT